MLDDLKLKPKNKLNLARIFLWIFLFSIIVILCLKAAGLNIYKPLTASKSLNDFAVKLESYWYADILINSILAFICMYFITFSLARQYGIKGWKHQWKNLILILLAIGFTSLRIYVYPIESMSFIYDVIQYIITPLLFCKILLKIKFSEIIKECAIPYLCFLGLLHLSLTLNNHIVTNMFYGNFITFLLVSTEVYIGIICIYIIRNLEKKGD